MDLYRTCKDYTQHKRPALTRPIKLTMYTLEDRHDGTLVALSTMSRVFGLDHSIRHSQPTDPALRINLNPRDPETGPVVELLAENPQGKERWVAILSAATQGLPLWDVENPLEAASEADSEDSRTYLRS